ncbi:hypothetical protein N7475_000307 [Penicillium sp. IBT 31633x]|nr:hypothetical protein N7475_000307 [Penicillium sp. IBT 31633x]
MVGWTCLEELELHKLFNFMVEHRNKIPCSSCRQAAITIQKWQRLVAGIRHAAVHRLSQDRESLLRVTRVAIEFSLCIGGLSAHKSFGVCLSSWKIDSQSQSAVERSQDGTSSTKRLFQDCASKV